jgi:hypothetical protein
MINCYNYIQHVHSTSLASFWGCTNNKSRPFLLRHIKAANHQVRYYLLLVTSSSALSYHHTTNSSTGRSSSSPTTFFVTSQEALSLSCLLLVTFANIMRRTVTSCDISVLAGQPFQAKPCTKLLAVEYV